MGHVDLEGWTSHLHDLGGPPEGVVRTRITNLPVQLVRRSVTLDEIVGGDPQVVEQVWQLSALLKSVAVLDAAPGKHGRGRGHRETKLHVVSSVKPTASEITTDVRTISHRRVATPTEATKRRFRYR